MVQIGEAQAMRRPVGLLSGSYCHPSRAVSRLRRLAGPWCGVDARWGLCMVRLVLPTRQRPGCHWRAATLGQRGHAQAPHPPSLKRQPWAWVPRPSACGHPTGVVLG